MENNNRNFIIGLVALAIVIIVLVGWGFNRDKIQSNNQNEPQASSQNTNTSQETPKYFSQDATVMFFYSEGCGWCQKEKEVLAKLADEGYSVKPIDAAKDRDSFVKYQVNSTPTFVDKNGEKLIGYQEQDVLKKWLDEHK